MCCRPQHLTACRLPLCAPPLLLPTWQFSAVCLSGTANEGDTHHQHTANPQLSSTDHFDALPAKSSPSPCTSPRISAARAPITATGELGLPLLVSGITLASATRKPSTPWTRNVESTTESGALCKSWPAQRNRRHRHSKCALGVVSKRSWALRCRHGRQRTWLHLHIRS